MFFFDFLRGYNSKVKHMHFVILNCVMRNIIHFHPIEQQTITQVHVRTLEGCSIVPSFTVLLRRNTRMQASVVPLSQHVIQMYGLRPQASVQSSIE